MKVAIRRINLPSLGKMGCLLGTVAALLPSLLCGLLALGAAGLLARWLQSWQQQSISLLGQEVATFDLIQFLGLEKVLAQLQLVTSISGPVLFLVVLLLALISGLFLALITILVGLAYNLLSAATGGLVVEMAAVPGKSPATAQEPEEDHSFPERQLPA
jgi:hypothetical protein